MLAVLKCQQFKKSGSDKTELKGSKRQRLDKRDDEKENSLDKDDDKIKSTRYIPPSFVLFSPLFRKVLNCSSDLGKGTRSLNYLICIPKICYLRSANFVLEFSGRGGSKAQKKIYTSRLREELESHSAFTASTVSGTTNHCYLIRECLESHPPSN